jgi:cell division protein FtsI (penicillin-binding protein 3)
MQQSLEYLNVPHDTEIRTDPKRQLMLAKLKDSDLEEGGALDREGPGPDFNEADSPKQDSVAVVAHKAPASSGTHIIPTALAAAPPVSAPPAAESESPTANTAASAPPNSGGPVTVDVGSSLAVPSLLGKSVRGVIEIAQHDGFEVSVVGSGIARAQSPAPGSRLTPGERVTVRFSR